jgi:predicted metal-dependent enzyme (double-stranded beta helix superfamily)
MSTPSFSFDLPHWIAECERALREDQPARAIRELVTRALSAPEALLRALGEPRRAEIQTLHHTAELTILNVVWAPRMTIAPHDHRMWAVIGLYTGREDNIFWRRVGEGDEARVEAAGAQALRRGDVVTLGRELIHSVTNPIPRFTGALHLYGGDFFAQSRSQWDAETLREGPFDGEKARRAFQEANERLGM